MSTRKPSLLVKLKIPPRKLAALQRGENIESDRRYSERMAKRRKRAATNDLLTPFLAQETTLSCGNNPEPSASDIMDAIDDVKKVLLSGVLPKLTTRGSSTSQIVVERPGDGGNMVTSLYSKPHITTSNNSAAKTLHDKFQDILIKMGQVDLLNRHTIKARKEYDDRFQVATWVVQKLERNQTQYWRGIRYASLEGVEDFHMFDDFVRTKKAVERAEEREAEARGELATAMLDYQVLLGREKM